MKDIVLCRGTDCKRKESCVRFTQPPKAKHQAYLLMSVSIKDIDNCKFFIKGEDNARLV